MSVFKARSAGTLDGRIQAVNRADDCDPTGGWIKRLEFGDDPACRAAYIDAYVKAFTEQSEANRRPAYS